MQINFDKHYELGPANADWLCTINLFLAIIFYSSNLTLAMAIVIISVGHVRSVLYVDYAGEDPGGVGRGGLAPSLPTKFLKYYKDKCTNKGTTVSRTTAC